MSSAKTVLPILCLALLLPTGNALAGSSVHVTYLWHLEQPIYWPAPNAGGLRYQTAWDSILAQQAGATHPANDLDEIFGKDDRVAAYQWRPRDAVQAMLGLAQAGAQVSYSGGLIENVASLATVNQLGYSASWDDPFREAMGWSTSSGHPRLDIVQFSFHHALIPLIHPDVLRMELMLYRQVYPEAWGAGDQSRGFFPSEMAFAEHVIPVLVQTGIEWVIVSNSHLSRACENYPFVAGSGGDNIPPPNRADIQNPAQDHFNRISIDRGVSPANAVPFSYQPHFARYVDPHNGAESRIIVVPAAQSESWQDGYSCFGLGPLDALAPYNETSQPILVLLAHDGDNAFGGGYSYYMECTPNLVNAASSAGYTPTTVQQYLDDHPPAVDDIVHVESGAWVNADGDFGAPSFLNWNWPLVNSSGQFDLANGWAEDERNWAIITAATNHVLTADALAGPPDLAKVLHPDTDGTTALERAWHYLLGSLNSGYMYYGSSLDMELKPVVACNEAIARAQPILAGGQDPVGPTVWLPQRYPDNPGGINAGPLYGYRETTTSSDFWVWTFAYDLSDIQTVTLWIREDHDGSDPLSDDDNQTFFGGPGVGSWLGYPMTFRDFPAAPPYPNPQIDTSILPTAIADLYFVQVTGYSDVLLDYFVEATDTEGNSSRSPIQHVYVGEGGGGTPQGVHWEPTNPSKNDVVTVYSPEAGWLHWGINGWQEPDEVYWPAGSEAFGDDQSVETPLTGPDGDGFYQADIGPFTAGSNVTVVDFVIRHPDNTWDNNGGSDYHIPISDQVPVEPFEADWDPYPDSSPDAGDRGPELPDAGDLAPDSPTDAGEDSTVQVDGEDDRGGATDQAGGDQAGGDQAGGTEPPQDDGCNCGSVPARGNPQAPWIALMLLACFLANRRRPS
ncbi:MAG: hypothetical protein JW797_14885 [Bradymonadales bacterium]|nr:hypothetical protein [Bradymonadales bacterium]